MDNKNATIGIMQIPGQSKQGGRVKIKRIKKLKVNCYDFTIKYTKEHRGGSFCYADKKIEIGTRNNSEEEIFMVICHELMEICAVEMNVRFCRPDVSDDYIFVYDHRQHDTMMCMFSGLLSQFVN